MENVLSIDNLSVSVRTDSGKFNVIHQVSFEVAKGEVLGIVGESGCGKTMTARSIIDLLPSNASVTEGEIFFQNENLCKLKTRQKRKICGNKIAMIFQEPMASLNPVYTIGAQISEMIQNHRKLSKADTWNYAVEMLKKVKIPRAEEIMKEYSYQLSGGMCQRIMIAIAMACNPDLLIADEPTTALDVTIQAQIMELIKDLQKQTNMSVILITHDMGVVAEMCKRVIVMYAGEIVEDAEINELFEHPRHPYTKALLDSIPSLTVKRDYLPYIHGTVPNPKDMPCGCRFAPRCTCAKEICFQKEPSLDTMDGKSKVRCWLYQDEISDTKEEKNCKAP